MHAYLRLFKLRIVVTVHSTGRLFSLSVEWISTNPWRGSDLATPLSRGYCVIHYTNHASNTAFGGGIIFNILFNE